MNEVPVSDYDTFAYPSAVYSHTHPDRLATVATLFGLQPARIERARVLELGCGDGINLISMAVTLPGTEFHGVDLAVEPIRRGQEVIAALGLKNVSLRQMNILEMSADIGAFDYIIAHGLYSWVPEPVREKILAICREHLAGNGVAYISYNAYPGCHLRDLTRGMMRFHVQQFSEPREQIRQARAFLKFLSEAKSKPGLWEELLRHQFVRIEKYIDGGFFHDDLSPVNQPFYFYEFMDAAVRHQLHYLGEADFRDMQMHELTEEAMRVMQKMEDVNRVVREQYLDFIEGRSFRRTLLCRPDRQLDRELNPERISNLFVAADVAAVKPGANMAMAGSEDFQRGEIVIATGQPMLKSALTYLGNAWPRRVPFSELLDRAREMVLRSAAHPAGGTGSDHGSAQKSGDQTVETGGRHLAAFLLRCYALGFVDLHSYPSNIVTDISERPMASPLARWQICQGQAVSTLRHVPLKIEDALGREVLRLLDGTRDRAALLNELSERVKAGSTPIYSDGKQVVETEKALELLAAQLDVSLGSLARLGLLTG
jgi:methyltransferase-like protein/trans-aconitate methyltransferase